MVWIVAMTKPNQEAIAVENLQRQGYEPYCPRYQQKRPNKPALTRPLFPRYIFVNIENFWYSIKGTRGVSYVLAGEGGPQKVPDQLIDNLKSREDKLGLISLEPKARFNEGAKVRVGDGPLLGHQLIYEGMTAHERCTVLVALLGRAVRVELPEKTLIAA